MALITLAQTLDPARYGNKAANLSQIKRAGLAVPEGWVCAVDQALEPFATQIPLTQTVIVRSSAPGEDSLSASAAGQYVTVPDIQDRVALTKALRVVRQAAQNPNAQQYRQNQGQQSQGMALLVQVQIRGVISGVLFTRSPLNGRDLVIEALAGGAEQIVAGTATPEQFFLNRTDDTRTGTCPLPPEVLEQLIRWAGQIERLFKDVPQDIEWTWDGSQLWILQSRTITTLMPIWTRTIAAEVIPGLIRPLTWSLNQPLTCSVWGEVFGLVLKDTQGLDFQQTATLHQHRAYFNATLLGEIFGRMGLPEEGLEFLIRGKKMSRPPLAQVLPNVPGLWRLIQRERGLVQAWEQEDQAVFEPLLAQLHQLDRGTLIGAELLIWVERITAALRAATFFNILAPIGLAVRQAIFKPTVIDYSQSPEVAAINGLKALAQAVVLPQEAQALAPADLWPWLIRNQPQVITKIDQLIQKFGYLSESNTDISAVTWQESPQTVYTLFCTLVRVPDQDKPEAKLAPSQDQLQQWRTKAVQSRVDLKAKIARVYGQLIAHWRWTFLAIGDSLVAQGVLSNRTEIFYLTYDEIQQIITNGDTTQPWSALIQHRQRDLERYREQRVPAIVYGTCLGVNEPVVPSTSGEQLKGIPASPGIVEGEVLIVTNLSQSVPQSGQILVVPYTDAAWVVVLVDAKGIISEVGGQLSHGAIIAREYRIPAVMNIDQAMTRLQNGQRVRLDGARGTVEILG